MNKVKFVLFSVGILLASAFVFGCSNDDGGGNSERNGSLSSSSKGSNNSDSSSSTGISSSSSFSSLVQSSSGKYNPSLSSSTEADNQSSSSIENPLICIEEPTHGGYGQCYIQYVGDCNYNGNGDVSRFSDSCPYGYLCFDNSKKDNNGNVMPCDNTCNGYLYDTETQFCYGNIGYGKVFDKCNGNEYNPEEQFCYNNSKVGDYCGRKEDYDPDLYECRYPNKIYLKGGVTDSRDGKKYNAVLIGGQTWLAENLNYNASGSECYNYNPSNCEIYGRLYDWPTALNFPAGCYSQYCATDIHILKYQGICPSGWHIPRDQEWSLLYHYAEHGSHYGSINFYESPTAGKYLKSKSWDGEDKFGFAALPGGWRRPPPNMSGQCYFCNLDYWAGWWTTTETGDPATKVSTRIIITVRDGAYEEDGDKSSFASVRCIKD